MTNTGFVSTKRNIGRKLKPTDPDFVAPDGGWGWLVVFACGLSNLSIFSMYQQFGLVFTDKFQEIGITHAQTTTVFNINLALSSCIGLLNGPIYKRFSFRQVGLFGSILVVCSLLIVSWCKSFWSYFVFYGILYGSSIGITQSANTLALNTYFKKKRSIATGLSWGTTGIGPIFWPYVITVLINYYKTEGTVLLFAGFAGHAIMCSLLLQPVHWHTKHREETEVPLMSLYPKLKMERASSLPINLNISAEITNDSQPYNYIDSSYKSINIETEKAPLPEFWINSTQKVCHKSELYITTKHNLACEANFNNSKSVDTKPTPSFSQKIIKFFDLDILKDLVYLNIIFGMISVCFVEFNLALLTPDILKEFNFGKYEIATYLSILEATDMVVRFSFPFITRKIKWNYRIYFLIGTLASTLGRIGKIAIVVTCNSFSPLLVLIHTQKFQIALFVAVIVGFGKGLMIVYLAMLIPNHVSLLKLPAALGNYMAIFGIFSILMAPVAGWIHILHISIYIAALSWILEYLYKKKMLRANINEANI